VAGKSRPLALSHDPAHRPVVGCEEEHALPESQIIRLNHIHIICSDLTASESWFVEGIGADLVERRESRGMATSELRLAGICLLLRAAHKDEALAAGRQRRYGTDHFGLEVADVDATVETLRARGVVIAREPANSPRNRVAFIQGPDNLVIELVEPQ
jgi:catechol 2,3-dioxygenase-like lactoylglutathione lyase family enzyme